VLRNHKLYTNFDAFEKDGRNRETSQINKTTRARRRQQPQQTITGAATHELPKYAAAGNWSQGATPSATRPRKVNTVNGKPLRVPLQTALGQRTYKRVTTANHQTTCLDAKRAQLKPMQTRPTPCASKVWPATKKCMRARRSRPSPKSPLEATATNRRKRANSAQQQQRTTTARRQASRSETTSPIHQSTNNLKRARFVYPNKPPDREIQGNGALKQTYSPWHCVRNVVQAWQYYYIHTITWHRQSGHVHGDAYWTVSTRSATQSQWRRGWRPRTPSLWTWDSRGKYLMKKTD